MRPQAAASTCAQCPMPPRASHNTPGARAPPRTKQSAGACGNQRGEAMGRVDRRGSGAGIIALDVAGVMAAKKSPWLIAREGTDERNWTPWSGDGDPLGRWSSAGANPLDSLDRRTAGVDQVEGSAAGAGSRCRLPDRREAWLGRLGLAARPIAACGKKLRSVSDDDVSNVPVEVPPPSRSEGHRARHAQVFVRCADRHTGRRDRGAWLSR